MCKKVHDGEVCEGCEACGEERGVQLAEREYTLPQLVVLSDPVMASPPIVITS